MELDLAGKWVLITGASKGIGAGTARSFAAEGANLHLVARGEEGLERIKREIVEQTEVHVYTHSVDVGDSKNLGRLLDACEDIDILVNNAGGIRGGTIEAVDEATWREGWDVKIYGFVNLTRLAYGRMKRRGSGVIINVIGNAGEVLDPNYIAGTTGNAALMAFSRALGAQSLDAGIRVLGVNPGPVDTGRIRTLLKQRAREEFGDESRWETLMTRFPLGRPASVPDVADMIVFLASDRCTYVSGTIVTVDGGIASRGSVF